MENSQTADVRIFVNNIRFRNSTEINISENEVVIIVGPNNSGKSLSLNELWHILSRDPHSDSINLKIINGFSLQKKGTVEELQNFLNNASSAKVSEDFEYYKINLTALRKIDVHDYWFASNPLIRLGDLFLKKLSTEDRLFGVSSPSSINLISQPPVHPIHHLQINDTLEEQISKFFRQAFGKDLIVHRNAGNIVPLYIGTRPTIKEGQDRVSFDYLKEVEALDKLEEQGDGMKSFTSIILNSFIGPQSILMIDEPEAFLHPPQARLLGKMLIKDIPRKKQLFIATHSEDFLKGVLDSNHDRVTIVRIQRETDGNEINVLDNDKINQIWRDPLLRHSNILSGLFHTKVIVCESDSDCKFFSSILNILYEGSEQMMPDILFTHCGGKHRIPVVVKALKELNVPITVITDFDVLNDENPLRPIFESLGGDWKEIEKDWKIVKSAIEAKRPELLASELKEEIDSIFSSIQSKSVSKNNISDIQKVLKKASPWTEAKSNGKSYIPAGDASQAFERLKKSFITLGLYVLEVGELECFDKTIGGHGPKWVNEVLSKDIKNDPNLEAARSFVKKIIE